MDIKQVDSTVDSQCVFKVNSTDHVEEVESNPQSTQNSIPSSIAKFKMLQKKFPVDVIRIAAEVENITIQAAALATIHQNENKITRRNTHKSLPNTNVLPKEMHFPSTSHQMNNQPSCVSQFETSSVHEMNCDEIVDVFQDGKISLSIILFGSLYFLLGKMFNYAESDGIFLNWSFLIGGLILITAEFSMMIYLVSLGFLAFFITARYKVKIQRILYVVLGVHELQNDVQIILGFLIVIFCLPPWLYIRDYSVQCLLHRNCVFFLTIFQALSDCVCGRYNSCAPLTLCQAVMLSLPITVMTLVPAVIAIYIYLYYLNHRHTIQVSVCPPPVPPPDPIYTFNRSQYSFMRSEFD